MMLSIKRFYHSNPHNPPPVVLYLFPQISFRQKHTFTQGREPCRSSSLNPIMQQKPHRSYCARTRSPPTHMQTHTPIQPLLLSGGLLLKLLTSTEKVNLDVDGLAGIEVKWACWTRQWRKKWTPYFVIISSLRQKKEGCKMGCKTESSIRTHVAPRVQVHYG